MSPDHPLTTPARQAELTKQKDPAPLHYEFAKGYLPTANPKNGEIDRIEDAPDR